jgi:hypothetical protein
VGSLVDSGSFTVTVNDTEDPVIASVSNISVPAEPVYPPRT